MCRILSGVFQGRTLGTPISIMVQNTDARPEAYKEMETIYRPSHADFTYHAKYGIRNWQGGRRASARETIGRVAAGAVAKKLLKTLFPQIEILAYVTAIHDIKAEVNPETVTASEVEANVVRCPDTAAAAKMIERIKQVRSDGDSVGGVLEGVIRHAPPGLGEPVFDKLEADLAKAMLSLPATKGFEIGSGFAGSSLKGSEHNDAFRMKGTRVRTLTNFSGGVQGGISNGEPVVFRVAFKPTATIAKPQQTVTVSSRPIRAEPHERVVFLMTTRSFIGMIALSVILMPSGHTSVQGPGCCTCRCRRRPGRAPGRSLVSRCMSSSA